VYDLYYREGSARHPGIGIPHVIAASDKAARSEAVQATSVMDTPGFCAVE
jgi:hypothetical protein